MNVFSNLAARTRVPNLTPRTTRIALTSGILLGGVALSALIVATAQSHPPEPKTPSSYPMGQGLRSTL